MRAVRRLRRGGFLLLPISSSLSSTPSHYSINFLLRTGVKLSGPRFTVAHLARRVPHVSLQQLRLKIRQVKVLSVRLNLSLLVDLENADAVHEEHLSGLRLET